MEGGRDTDLHGTTLNPQYERLPEDRRAQIFDEVLENKSFKLTTLIDAEKIRLFDAIIAGVLK